MQENENAVRPVGRELRGAGDPGHRLCLAARGGQGLSGISLRGEKIQRNLSTPSKECPAGDSILIKRKNSLKKDEKECGWENDRNAIKYKVGIQSKSASEA